MCKMQLVKLHIKKKRTRSQIFMVQKPGKQIFLDFQVSDPMSIQKIQIKPIKFW